MIFLAALLRFGIGDTSERLVLCVVGIFGMSLSCSWFVVIKSYRQLNTEKFRVLHDLETKLAYPFFTLEWDPKSEGRKSNRYWRAYSRRTDFAVHLSGPIFRPDSLCAF